MSDRQKDFDRIEGALTKARIEELRSKPVQGNFDAAHLCEVNRRIFQDLPSKGFKDVYPGEYRPPVQGGGIWYKERQLTSVDARSLVVYSKMGEDAQKQLDQVLEKANPSELSKLDTSSFTQQLAEIYSKADYIHPFRDGNSRTLRAFTQQLAKESGYTVEWERFNQSDQGRDVLYLARDLSVNAQALSEVPGEKDRRAVQSYIDRFEGNKNLAELMKGIVRPSRAIAFEQLPPEQAKRQYPELSEALSVQQVAAKYFEKKFPGDDEKQEQLMAGVNSRLQQRLDAGDVRGFSNNDRQLATQSERQQGDIER